MEKIKSFVDSSKGKDILTIMIVILVGIGSFELGRLSKENASSGGLNIRYEDQANLLANTARVGDIKPINEAIDQINISKSPSPKTGNFFASKRGKKYYSISCSAGKTIKVDNRIYFDTREEAEKVGFELSSACR